MVTRSEQQFVGHLMDIFDAAITLELSDDRAETRVNQRGDKKKKRKEF
jgi:broad-specificity NMP kinase